MRIGIITINDDNNYGNRLQNYAMQQLLSENNTVETIYNRKGIYTGNLKNIIKYKIKTIIKCFSPLRKHKRYKNFMKFEKNIKYSKIKVDSQHISPIILNMYDYFVVGSDQVWNPFFNKMTELELLTFAPGNKRIALSASFGVDNIQNEKKEFLKDELQKFKYISVREESGKKIIKELDNNIKVDVLVDPTLALDEEKWTDIMKKPNIKLPEKYILLYYLGNITEEIMNQIIKYSNDNDCKIINIMDKNSIYYTLGPSEFLYMIKNANLVLTDSFHACVFSIIFKRKFVVFERNEKGQVKMNSRISTLLNLFEITDRYYNGNLNDILDYNYAQTSKKIEEQKKKYKEIINTIFN